MLIGACTLCDVRVKVSLAPELEFVQARTVALVKLSPRIFITFSSRPTTLNFYAPRLCCANLVWPTFCYNFLHKVVESPETCLVINLNNTRRATKVRTITLLRVRDYYMHIIPGNNI